ncbi:GNAT family acetyltransferase, partial [Lactobacillus gasseri]|nr:GNAT family acetyltransferase [Lactobacillus gasseri]
IFFEADDTDWAATKLLDCFNVDKENSFNTYIYI